MVTVEAVCFGKWTFLPRLQVGQPPQCKAVFRRHVDIELVDNSKKPMVVQVCCTHLYNLVADISDTCVQNDVTPASHKLFGG